MLRHWSKVGLYCARCASGTLLLMQASYLAMKSSHSGTPTFSPLPELVVVVEAVLFVVVVLEPVVALSELAVLDVELFEAVSDPPHATNRSAKDTHSTRGMKVLFNN